nr:hypothetical protein [uncultured Desulfuromonas sp.]
MNRFAILRHLYPALRDHQRVEHTLNQLLKKTLDPVYLDLRKTKPKLMSFYQRNFFSILFLSIYRALKITPAHRQLYGVINQSIRGIVTGCDNLLDDEYKAMLPLAFPPQAQRFSSVMHILLFDRFLEQILDKAVTDGLLNTSDKEAIHKQIFSALVAIGAEEASEEGGVSTILRPDQILTTVHALKGGELLRLAFITPCYIEKSPAVRQADQAIYKIGLALQVIDDMTDLVEDLCAGHHNYLVSTIHHEGTAQEQETLKACLSAPEKITTPIDVLFPTSTRRVIERAIGEALNGFTELHDAGFWLNRRDAFGVIRDLFHLRGLSRLDPLWPDYQDHHTGLSETIQETGV